MSIVLVFLLSFFGASLDDGNGFDPLGGPRISSTGDEGNGFDPHG